MTLDDIDRMTSRELRENLRKEKEKVKKEQEARKQEREAQENAIAQKEAKLNELEQKLRYQEPPTKEQLAAVQLEPLKKNLFEHLLQAQFHLDEAVSVAAAAQKVEGATFPQLQEWAKAHYEQLAPIGDLFEELDQALNNCGPDKKE
jgi:DNA repair exonuclease SbcCD ATPase subunit